MATRIVKHTYSTSNSLGTKLFLYVNYKEEYTGSNSKLMITNIQGKVLYADGTQSTSICNISSLSIKINGENLYTGTSLAFSSTNNYYVAPNNNMQNYVSSDWTSPIEYIGIKEVPIIVTINCADFYPSIEDTYSFYGTCTVRYHANPQEGGKVDLPTSEYVGETETYYTIQHNLSSTIIHSDTFKNLGAIIVNGYSNGGNSPDITKESVPVLVTRRVFSHWNTEADGSGTDYGTENVIGNSAIYLKKDMDLYAQWDIVETEKTFPNPVFLGSLEYGPDPIVEVLYKVTLNPRGATCEDTKLEYLKTIPYVFKEWNTEVDGSGTSYVANTEFTESIELYAQWELLEEPVYGPPIILPTLSEESCEFCGWSENMKDSLGVFGEYIPSKDTILYAIWKVGKLGYGVYLGTQRIEDMYLGSQPIRPCIPEE